jgi:hypothetical protein
VLSGGVFLGNLHLANREESNGAQIERYPGNGRQHAGRADQRLAPAGVNLYVKIEAFNPLGSVKDRLALGVIEAAEKRRR